MAFIDPRTGINVTGLGPPTLRIDDGVFVQSSSNVESIITEPVQGFHTRELVRWRTPAFGWIKMFLNPENITITEGKDIQSTRTKAGFIFQYAGEKLTEISMRGTTGSSGVEGINILRAIYRAEQIAFDRIADELERSRVPITELLTRGSRSDGTTAVEQAVDLLLNIFIQPFPTLASLAANTELYFQGLLFRGYFTQFVVEESAQSPGIFNYTISFTAYARQGVRRNFMPWHRQPFNPIGLGQTESNPLSFRDRATESDLLLRDTEAFLESRIEQALDVVRGRSTSTGSGSLGGSLQDIDLEDFI